MAQKSLTYSEVKKRQDKWDTSNRVATLDISNEDVVYSEPQIYTYYCAICGIHAIVSDSLLSDVPIFENSHVFNIDSKIFRSYLKSAEQLYIQRDHGIEPRKRCSECDYIIGFQSDVTSKFLYIFLNTIVYQAAKAETFQQHD